MPCRAAASTIASVSEKSSRGPGSGCICAQKNAVRTRSTPARCILFQVRSPVRFAGPSSVTPSQPEGVRRACAGPGSAVIARSPRRHATTRVVIAAAYAQAARGGTGRSSSDRAAPSRAARSRRAPRHGPGRARSMPLPDQPVALPVGRLHRRARRLAGAVHRRGGLRERPDRVDRGVAQLLQARCCSRGPACRRAGGRTGRTPCRRCRRTAAAWSGVFGTSAPAKMPPAGMPASVNAS